MNGAVKVMDSGEGKMAFGRRTNAEVCACKLRREREVRPFVGDDGDWVHSFAQ